MSLRTDIHTAFDVITPDIGGMPERVVETARREARVRQRRRRFMLRMRAPMTLVAVFVVVAIVVALFIGAQAVRMWNAQHTTAPAAAMSGLAQLEARPVTLPSATSQADCPATPNTNAVFDFGPGPVYADGGPQTNTAWGYYWDVSYYPDPLLVGPVLIRGRDLISGETLIFSGQHAVGPIASGSGQPPGWRTEAALDPSAQPTTFRSGHGGFQLRQALSKQFIGCFGIQIDGRTFTEKITGFVAP